jgi:hypothetical protein
MALAFIAGFLFRFQTSSKNQQKIEEAKKNRRASGGFWRFVAFFGLREILSTAGGA